MNQQRARRFRSAQEAQEKDEDKAEFIKMLKQQNGGSIDDVVNEHMNKKTWDSNAITPGHPSCTYSQNAFGIGVRTN